MFQGYDPSSEFTSGLSAVPELQQRVMQNALTRQFGVPSEQADLALKQAQAKRENAMANLPFGGMQLPGVAGQVVGLEMIKNAYGANSPEYQQASNAFTLQQSRIGTEMAYQNALANSLPERTLTPEGKAALEAARVQGGQAPTGQTWQNAVSPGSPLTMGQQQVNQMRALQGQGPVYTQQPSVQNAPAYAGGVAAQLMNKATGGKYNYDELIKDAATSADTARNTNMFLDQFDQGYKNSKYTGGVEGTFPTTGLSSIPFRLAAGKDLSNEQMTDNASQNIAATVAKLIAGGRVTNYEMQYINQLKPNRTMDPQAAQMASGFLRAKMQRLGEEPDFLNAAMNQGTPPQIAQSLWNSYNNQRPVYDFKNNAPNDQYQGTWKDYLSPTAVNAVQNGQQFVPKGASTEKVLMISPNGQRGRVRADQVQDALKQGYRMG